MEKFAKPSTNRDGETLRKVIVFTAFADTTQYLWTHLAKPLHESTGVQVALVAGSGSNQTTLGKPDFELNVKHRVEARMALVDLTASGEDNLLDSQQFEDLIESELHYRNKQLKRLQNEILDLEDLDEEVISLADFSLTEFVLGLIFPPQESDKADTIHLKTARYENKGAVAPGYKRRAIKGRPASR